MHPLKKALPFRTRITTCYGYRVETGPYFVQDYHMFKNVTGCSGGATVAPDGTRPRDLWWHDPLEPQRPVASGVGAGRGRQVRRAAVRRPVLHYYDLGSFSRSLPYSNDRFCVLKTSAQTHTAAPQDANLAPQTDRVK